MLALFRYPVNYYWPQIVFTSTICSVLSYILSVENDIPPAPLIQMAVMILCIWLMFYTPLLWSLIVVMSFSIIYVVFQGGLIYLLFRFGMVPPVIPLIGLDTYLIQIFCSLMCLVFGYYCIRKRIGFLFVPTNREAPFSWNKTGGWLFFGSVLSFSSLGVIYRYYAKANSLWFLILLGILSTVFVGLLIAMRMKNREYVEKPGHH